jgi:hypothetical protein
LVRTRRRTALVAALVAASLVAGCTRADDETETGAAPGGAPAAEGGTAGGGGAPGDRLDAAGFGELENVCGEAAGDPAAGAQETGLTADEIRLGTITDKGSAERPGLTQEMHDTAVAFAAWCNEHGGLQGREVVVDDLDAKLFDYGQRIADACQQDFALVGGGGVFDSQGVEEREACGLPNFPGYTVTPQARVADLQVQAIPNPVYEFQAASYRWLQQADDSATNFGILWVNLDGPATIHSQIVEGVEQLGYDVVFDEQYKPIGETGWRQIVQRMRDADVQTFEIVGEPENMVALQGAMQTEGWYPKYTLLQPNYIDQKFMDEGSGTFSESTYARSPFATFEMADEVPAMADYLALMERYNPDGKVAFLGAQGLSALLLFATSVNECGAELSRACVLEKAAAVEDWTAGGLHSRMTPGNAEATECSLMVHITPDGFQYDEELSHANDGIFGCDPENVLQLTDDYGVPEPAA